MTTAVRRGPTKRLATQDDRQVVVLSVRGDDYAVPIECVQEIVRVPTVTRVPNAEPGVEGVINLRGRVLPVLDLAARLGFGPAGRAADARIVVVEQTGGAIGLLGDGVSEVLNLSGTQIDPPCGAGNGDEPWIEGVAKVGERLILLLDLEVALGAPR